MEFYFKNWVQLSCDFVKVAPSGTTQGKVCRIGKNVLEIPISNGTSSFFDIMNYHASKNIININVLMKFS